MDKYYEQFLPEKVDEQIEQLSHSETSQPRAQFMHDLGKIYENAEDVSIVEHVWERLNTYTTEHTIDVLPHTPDLELLPDTLNDDHQGENPHVQPERSFARKKIIASRFTQIAAVLVTTLLISSMFWMFHQARSGTSSVSIPQKSSPGIYICCVAGILEKVDVQTHRVIWHTHISASTITPTITSSSGNRSINGLPQQQNADGDIEVNGDMQVSGDRVYLPINNTLYAYNTKTGALLWFHIFPVTNSVFGPYISIVDGQLYAFFNNPQSFLALNPVNGTTIAIYKSPGANVTIVDNILYYTANNDLYAMRLPDKNVIWHQHFSKNEVPFKLKIKSGIVYIITLQTSSTSNGTIYTFDARTGKKLWQSSQFSGPIGTITAADSMFYVFMVNGGLYAFDTHTHAQIWYQPFNVWGIFMETPVVLYDSGVLYLNTYHNNAPSSILAIRATDGKILWQKNSAYASVQHIYHGVLYCMSTNTYKSSTIYAFNTNNGSQLSLIPVNNNTHLWQFTVG